VGMMTVIVGAKVVFRCDKKPNFESVEP
jgi:hypothetical protein